MPNINKKAEAEGEETQQHEAPKTRDIDPRRRYTCTDTNIYPYLSSLKQTRNTIISKRLWWRFAADSLAEVR